MLVNRLVTYSTGIYHRVKTNHNSHINTDESQFGGKDVSHKRIHKVWFFYIKFKTSYPREYVRVAYTDHKSTEQQVSYYLKSHNVYHEGPGRVMQSKSYKGVKSILVHNLVVGLWILALSCLENVCMPASYTSRCLP